MSRYGIVALKNNKGEKISEFLKRYINENNIIKLSELFDNISIDNILNKKVDNMDFLYDNLAIAICELLIESKEEGILNYEGVIIKSFVTTDEDIDFLSSCIKRISEAKNYNREYEIAINSAYGSVKSYEKYLNKLIQLINRNVVLQN